MNKTNSVAVLIFILAFVFLMQSGWADVGPAISRQAKKQNDVAPIKSAPTSTESVPAKVSGPIESIQREEREEEEEKQAETTTAWFEGVSKNLIYDNLKIYPRFRTDYTLDSNILLEPTDERMDSIFREVPGVKIIVPFQDHYFKADYEAQLEQFVKTAKENAENQYFTSEMALNFTDLYLHVNEAVTHTSSRSGTTFTERIPRFENDVDTLIGYKWNRFTLEAGYENFYRSFDTSAEKHLNYDSNKWLGSLYMDLTAKTKIFFDYAFTSYDYSKDETRDGESNAFYGGIEGALFPKTTLYSKLGYERLTFDGSNEKEGNNFVAEVGALYKPVAKTTVDIGWMRSTEQAVFGDTNFFVQDKLFGRLRQRFTAKISGEADMAYTNQDYEDVSTTGAGTFTGERNDDLLTVDVKLLYQFTDWLGWDIKYQYNRRDSNASIFDYTDHLLTTGLAFEMS
ncbi:MAG: outer membrane beta-barrel protein [Candidatus Omnitrophica bacterium]|nr:outer membrane beta-barrel protein [Candidatus Omnitrophota bacterium]